MIEIKNRPVLAHALNGGIITNETVDYKIVALKLESLDGKDTISAYTDQMDVLENDFQIYETPDQIEIKRLQDIIDRQLEEIQHLHAPKTHRPRKHMTKEEVSDIEADINAGATSAQVEKEYDVSSWVYSQIKRGKHKHQEIAV